VYLSLKSSLRSARVFLFAFFGAGAVLSAGCHHQNYGDSGYGIGWVTVSNGTGSNSNNVQFASYVVTIDSITLTDAVGNQYTAIATPEPVDFTRITDIAELWGNATIPADTYVGATITLDYTDAQISVWEQGKAVAATLSEIGGAQITQLSVNVGFDPKNPLVVTNSYSTTNAQRVALDFDLAASNVVDMSNPAVPVVTPAPFFRFSNAAADAKLIRVRGPLVNSNLTTGTYSIYERPFFDETNSIGTLSLFNSDSTIYTINGTTYVGSAGLDALQQTSAGVTATLAYTNFQVTPSSNNAQGQPTGTAGIFHTLYMVGGGSLETNYTENMTGEVIARSGNTLTLTNVILAGAIVALYQGYFEYLPSTVLAQVTVGPSTVVTAEGNSTLTNLDYNSIAVGQRISAIGTVPTFTATNVVLNAVSPTPGSTAGQVRLLSTSLYGSLNSSTANSLSMNLLAIDEIPVSQFTFTGNGPVAPSPATFAVDTSEAGTLPSFPALPQPPPVWIDGLVNSFGAAPPDFLAIPNLYRAPTPDGSNSPVKIETEVPASLQVSWNSTTGTLDPFSTIAAAGIQVNLAAVQTANIYVGAETIPLAGLTNPVTIVPNTVANCLVVTNLPAGQSQQPCQTNFAYGPVVVTPSYTTIAISQIQQFNGFADFVAGVRQTYDPTSAGATPVPVVQFSANGYFNRSTNTFTANSIDVVL
jgi:hypothetical protein